MAAERPSSGVRRKGRRNHSLLVAWLVCAAFWGIVSIVDHVAAPARAPAEAEPIPALTEFVNDEMHILSADEKFLLNEKLSRFSRDTSVQMAVAILPGVPATAVEAFTMDVADAASIGQSGTDNGLILFVFPQQAVARLEVGYGMEGAIPDVLAYRLLTNAFKPAWLAGNPAQALDGVVDAAIGLGHAEYTATKGPGRLERLVRTLMIGSEKLATQAWPLLRAVSLPHRVAISFFAAFLLIGLVDGVRQLVGLLRNTATTVRNASGGRALDKDTKRVDLKAISDSVLLLLPFIGAIIAAAGVVLLAGGGEFGGGGATVRL